MNRKKLWRPTTWLGMKMIHGRADGSGNTEFQQRASAGAASSWLLMQMQCRSGWERLSMLSMGQSYTLLSSVTLTLGDKGMS